MIYLNEIERFACDWMQAIYSEAHIDRRSIADVAPADLAGFRRVHFFAGIGGWEAALRLAGWPEEKEVWTGSCPCQPFSVPGKRKGTADERHLWPELFRLIRECRPATVFGEQVASKDGLGWLDGVFADLEGAGYACGAADLCAASVGAPHIRQRLFWVANADGSKSRQRKLRLQPQNGDDRWNAAGGELPEAAGGLGDTSGAGLEGRTPAGRADECTPWAASVAIPCRDGKSRRVSAEPGDEPLAHGIPRDMGHTLAGLGLLGIDPRIAKRIAALARRNRVGRLRGYGNAIVIQAAAEFIRAAMRRGET